MARRIPSLDGIRAIAVLMVLLGHSVYGLPVAAATVVGWFQVSRVGVSVFFVLSGYLITRLLVEEQRRDGSISLKAFYVRRFFRIIPAYYVYLTCILLASRAGVLTLPRSGVVPAYLFIWNYSPQADGWFYAHTWSLSMEEQFYLLWPPLLAALGLRAGFRLAVGIILVSPLSRLATYALMPAFRGQIPAMLHSHGDVLMFGALLALGSGQPRFEGWVSWLFARKAHVIAGVALVVSTLVGHALRGGYMLPVGLSVEGASIAILLLWLVRNPDSAPGRVLNTRPLIFIGTLSYSIYLWQPAFLHREDIGWAVPFPASLLMVGLAAFASYRLVEAPFLRLRDRALARLRRAPDAVAARPAPHP